MKDTYNVVVYEDDLKYRQSLTGVISGFPNLLLVGAFGDCLEILNHVNLLKPDILMIDIEMPYMNGIDGMTLIKSKYPHIKIIILTHFDDDEKIFNAVVRGGADGYLLKNSIHDSIYNNILNVIEGGSVMSPYIAKRVLNFFYEPKSFLDRLSKKKSNSYKLTKSEQKVLEVLSQGYSYKMIASEMNLSVNTVKNHLKKIYLKLQVNSAPEAVSIAIRESLVN
ncbi:MAG: response regulator transcription factor [Saprospiraceae bacterium]|nr:response regulator transcription factor [Saprospiraceae bacterium]